MPEKKWRRQVERDRLQYLFFGSMPTGVQVVTAAYVKAGCATVAARIGEPNEGETPARLPICLRPVRPRGLAAKIERPAGAEQQKSILPSLDCAKKKQRDAAVFFV